MSASRIQLALLLAGLGIADLGAMQLARTGRLEFIGFVLVGLAAASVAALGIFAIRRDAARDIPRDLPPVSERRVDGGKHRFGLRSLMLGMVLMAVWFTGIAAMFFDTEPKFTWYRHWDWDRAAYAPQLLLELGPIWIMFVALAFVAGRKSLTGRMVFVFALLECAALAGFQWAMRR